MKLLTTIILFSVVNFFVSAVPEGFTDEEIHNNKMYTSYTNDCIAQTKVDEVVIRQFMKDFQGHGELAEDEPLHCFLACVLEKMNILLEDGTIDDKALLDHSPNMSPEKLDRAMACLTEDKKGSCEIAADFFGCLMKVQSFST